MKLKPKNILITGGSGFIGSHITDQCIERGYKVRILDIKEPHRNDVEFVNGGVTDRSILKKTMVDIDYIYHLAAVSNIDYVINKPIETIEYNAMGTAYLLEELKNNKVKRFFLASSVFVFEKSGHLYTSSKRFSEILCENYRSLYKTPYTILRFGTAFGPRNRAADVISIFVHNAIKGLSLNIKGTGKQQRNFIYVKDIAKGSVLSIERATTINQVLTIANNESTTIIGLAQLVKKIFNNQPDILYMDSQARESDYTGSINHINETYSFLGWEPEYDLMKGLEDYIKWYKNDIK